MLINVYLLFIIVLLMASSCVGLTFTESWSSSSPVHTILVLEGCKVTLCCFGSPMDHHIFTEVQSIGNAGSVFIEWGETRLKTQT